MGLRGVMYSKTWDANKKKICCRQERLDRCTMHNWTPSEIDRPGGVNVHWCISLFPIAQPVVEIEPCGR